MSQKINPDVTYFATTNFRETRFRFGIKQSDRAYHTYVLGKTGAGKSNLLMCKILQDVKYKRGLCLFDIHGDLIKTVSENIPKHRQKDVLYLNISDPNLSLGYNPLTKVSEGKRSLVTSSILESLKKLYSGSWGVKLEHILRYILQTLLSQPHANMRDILRIIHEPKFRELCVKNITNPDIKRFWLNEFPKYTKADLLPIQNKIGAFLVHPQIKRLMMDNKNSISFRSIMDKRKILLINISKGAIGTDVAHVLGSMLISSIASAAFNRISIPEKQRIPFHMYMDEFQNYTNLTLVDMLSELRKFKVTMTLAHQYLHQLDENIRYGVFGNVGTIICFRIGALDAECITKELFIDYLPLTIGDYIHLPDQFIYVRLMINGKPSDPFSATTLYYKEFL